MKIIKKINNENEKLFVDLKENFYAAKHHIGLKGSKDSRYMSEDIIKFDLKKRALEFIYDSKSKE